MATTNGPSLCHLAPEPVQMGSVFPPDMSVPGARVGAAHPAPVPWERPWRRTPPSASTKRNTLAARAGVSLLIHCLSLAP